MKKYIQRFMIIGTLLAGFSLAAGAQVIVKVRPARPKVVVVHPAAPSSHHVWIDGGWVVKNGRYVWTEGRWVVPPHGRVWVAGHWVKRRGGWVWKPGHWVRGRR